MFTMQNSYKPILMICAVVLGVSTLTSVHAQSRTNRNGQLAWPRTFSGQPDFDFERQEVINERKALEDNGEEVLATPGSFDTLLRVPVVDPFNFNATGEKKKDDAEESSRITFTELNQTVENTLVENSEFSTQSAESEELDLDKFETFLADIMNQALKSSEPDPEQINVQALLSRIRIQTIATSPLKYAVINNQRYQEGQALVVAVPTMPSLTPVVAAMNENIPAENRVGKDAYKQYTDVRDSLIKGLKEKRGKEPRHHMIKLPVKIHVQRIERRQITVNILGEEHVIELKYAL